MNADPATQLRLLDLQATDTALAQLAHRRSHLPEIAAIATQQRSAEALRHELVEAQTSVADIAVEQKRMENDVDAVRTRAARDEARMQAGGLPARELSGLQHEITTLARRQSSLEDDLLDVMERAEQADSDQSSVRLRLDAAEAELARLGAARDTAFGEIDASVAERRPQRDALVAQVPAELLALYERARAQGGTGAALLRQRRCEGCHIDLSGSELAAASSAAPDAVVRCDNCRAILVRTDESGL